MASPSQLPVWSVLDNGPLRITGEPPDDPEELMDGTHADYTVAHAAAVAGGMEALQARMGQWHREAEAMEQALQSRIRRRRHILIWTALAAAAACIAPLMVLQWGSSSPSDQALAQEYFQPYPDLYHFRDASHGDLSAAMTAYGLGNYARATQQLTALHHAYPDSVEIALYAGVAAVGAGQWETAKQLLPQVAHHPASVLAAHAQWYWVLAELGSGNRAVAAQQLHALVDDSTRMQAFSWQQRENVLHLREALKP